MCNDKSLQQTDRQIDRQKTRLPKESLQQDKRFGHTGTDCLQSHLANSNDNCLQQIDRLIDRTAGFLGKVYNNISRFCQTGINCHCSDLANGNGEKRKGNEGRMPRSRACGVRAYHAVQSNAICKKLSNLVWFASLHSIIPTDTHKKVTNPLERVQKSERVMRKGAGGERDS